MTPPSLRRSSLLALALGVMACGAPSVAQRGSELGPKAPEPVEAAQHAESREQAEAGDGDPARRAEPAQRRDRAKPPKRARVTWGAELSRCSPRELELEVRETSVELSSTLGGCMLKELRQPRAAAIAQRKRRLQIFTERADIDAAVSCSHFQPAPTVDVQRFTYAVLVDVIQSSERYELAFAVEDEKGVVHAGVRVRRICQGVAPYDVPTAAVLTVPGAERHVVLHRCPAVTPSCGPIP